MPLDMISLSFSLIGHVWMKLQQTYQQTYKTLCLTISKLSPVQSLGPEYIERNGPDSLNEKKNKKAHYTNTENELFTTPNLPLTI